MVNELGSQSQVHSGLTASLCCWHFQRERNHEEGSGCAHVGSQLISWRSRDLKFPKYLQ